MAPLHRWPRPDDPAADPGPHSQAHELGPIVRSLWRYLRMHGASPSEAEDLTQEAFVLATQKGALTADPAARWTFLQRSARFLFLRLRRSGRREHLLADAVDALWRRECSDGGEALIAAVRTCVAALEGRARTAIEMSYGIDQNRSSRAAIAAALGMQETGVKTLLQRVRQKLRECIDRRIGR